jgi:hypothetical protein
VGALKPRDLPEFKWVNTMLGNLKTTLAGAFKALKFRKYAQTYLAAFAYRFNQRFDLRSLVATLIVDVARGGRAKLNTPISGRAAPMGEDRARVFRSTEDEQTTTPEPLSGIQGQGGHRGFGR